MSYRRTNRQLKHPLRSMKSWAALQYEAPLPVSWLGLVVLGFTQHFGTPVKACTMQSGDHSSRDQAGPPDPGEASSEAWQVCQPRIGSKCCALNTFQPCWAWGSPPDSGRQFGDVGILYAPYRRGDSRAAPQHRGSHEHLLRGTGAGYGAILWPPAS